MTSLIGCCGAACSDCDRFPKECDGCHKIKGLAFWIRYTGEPICKIYDCCVNEKKLPHCGKCSGFPCEKCTCDDPRMTPEERMKIVEGNIERLRLEK